MFYLAEVGNKATSIITKILIVKYSFPDRQKIFLWLIMAVKNWISVDRFSPEYKAGRNSKNAERMSLFFPKFLFGWICFLCEKLCLWKAKLQSSRNFNLLSVSLSPAASSAWLSTQQTNMSDKAMKYFIYLPDIVIKYFRDLRDVTIQQFKNLRDMAI